jgi:hypothetical protein
MYFTIKQRKGMIVDAAEATVPHL